MNRSARLLQLLDHLRRASLPQTGPHLARQFGVSLRTLYRDIDTLREQGAAIDGEPGVGYAMRPGFLLPALMFTSDELEALLLGCRWARQQSDPELAQAATRAWERIRSALPTGLKIETDTSGLRVPPRPADTGPQKPWQATLRLAIRQQSKVLLRYADVDGRASERTIWPFAMGFFENCRVVAAWCELRQDFRHFRTDRVQDVTNIHQRYPAHRADLLARWTQMTGYGTD